MTKNHTSSATGCGVWPCVMRSPHAVVVLSACVSAERTAVRSCNGMRVRLCLRMRETFKEPTSTRFG